MNRLQRGILSFSAGGAGTLQMYQEPYSIPVVNEVGLVLAVGAFGYGLYCIGRQTVADAIRDSRSH